MRQSMRPRSSQQLNFNEILKKKLSKVVKLSIYWKWTWSVH